MSTILHLSDLHFGEKNKHFDKLLTSKPGAESLAEKILNHFSNTQIEDLTGPKAIVVTGDLTSKAEPGEFECARSFLEKLLVLFELTTDNLLIVPGNHDVSWGAEDLENDKKYTAFKNFYKNIKHTDWDEGKPTTITLDLQENSGKAVIFGFNSCSVESEHWSGLGYIDQNQLSYVDDWKKSNSNSNFTVRIAALHHHVMPVHNYHPSFKAFDPAASPPDKGNPPPVSLMLNASKLLKKCREISISAILHGHTHAPFSVVQTNYLDTDALTSGLFSGPVAVIGAGSPFSSSLDHFTKNHYQIIQIKGSRDDILYQIWPYYTKALEPSIDEMGTTEPILVPFTIGETDLPTIPQKSLSSLRNSLNRIFLSGYATDKETFYHTIYDDILTEIVKWIGTYFGKDMGNIVISRFFPHLRVYKNIAKHRYSEKVRHIAYPLDEQSITITTAKTGESRLIDSRNACEYASRKRDSLYKETLKGDDQCVMAIPLNSTNEKYAYAVIGFARARYSATNEYTDYDRHLVESIGDIIEDALRRAEHADIAYKRRQQLRLFSWINDFLKEKKYTSVIEDLNIITNQIYTHLGLEQTHGDAIAIFLPFDPSKPSFDVATCIAELGFGPLKTANMKYRLGKDEGLTGGIIDSRAPDYCLDHLNKKRRKSKRGKITSAKCEKSSTPMIDHHLSFVGVPLGKGNGNPPYNRGALVLNIATPAGQGITNIMESMYVEPLQIIAQLLDPIIEGPWKEFVLDKADAESKQSNLLTP